MEMKDVNVTYNNLVWKFNKNNKYPIQLYRDEHNTVLRTESGILFFKGYELGDNELKIENALASSTQKILAPDTSTNQWKNNTELAYTKISDVIKPALTFHIKNYDNALYDIMLEIYELAVTEDGTMIDVPDETARLIDLSLGYVGRAIADELDIIMARADCKRIAEKTATKEEKPKPKKKSFWDLLFWSYDEEQELKQEVHVNKHGKIITGVDRTANPYKLLSTINIAPVVIQAMQNNLIDSLKSEDNIKEILSPIILVFRVTC